MRVAEPGGGGGCVLALPHPQLACSGEGVQGEQSRWPSCTPVLHSEGVERWQSAEARQRGGGADLLFSQHVQPAHGDEDQWWEGGGAWVEGLCCPCTLSSSLTHRGEGVWQVAGGGREPVLTLLDPGLCTGGGGGCPPCPWGPPWAHTRLGTTEMASAGNRWQVATGYRVTGNGKWKQQMETANGKWK